MIPFLELRASYDELKPQLDEAFARFMQSGWYVLGKEVELFEEAYANYCAAEHCVGVGSGLDALHLSLRALDLGPGDEIIVPSNTYIATWLAVTQVGATIVPVEPDEATHNLCPLATAAALTSKTKAIMPVNLYGQPVDYDAFSSLANKHQLKIVIDNAQAQGARYKGRRVGALADIECHSYYPSKNLGAFGEAGAITTNSPAIAERIRSLRNYGSRQRYVNEECGYNSRIDALQAAFLRVKLDKLDAWNEKRSQIAQRYIDELSDVEQISLPSSPDWAGSVWHLFVIRHQHRDAFQEKLKAEGVQTLIHYPIPPHASQAYATLNYSEPDFPVAMQLAQSVLSLPLHPYLDDQQVDLVISAVRAAAAA